MQSDTHSLSFASDSLPWQRSLRWERVQLDARRIALGVLLGAFLTTIELAGFGIGMRWQIAREVRHPPAAPVQVELVDEQVLPMPPEPDVPTKIVSPRAPTTPRRRTQVNAPPVSVETPQTPMLQLFDRDGSVRLPESPAHGEGEVAFGAHSPGPPNPFARRNPVPYAPTYFERAWVPGDESLGAELIRRTTFSHTWRTPWGTQIGCAVSLVLAVIGGCGWGYAPTATIDELKAIHADPPLLNGALTTETPTSSEEPSATPDGP